MLHTLLTVPNFDETIGFHHSLGFGRSPAGPAFNHFCVLMDHMDDVMRYRHNAASLGVRIDQDLLRHPTSGPVGVYLGEPFSGFRSRADR